MDARSLVWEDRETTRGALAFMMLTSGAELPGRSLTGRGKVVGSCTAFPFPIMELNCINVLGRGKVM